MIQDKITAAGEQNGQNGKYKELCMRKSILAAILVFSIFVSACTVQNKEEKPAPEAAQPAAATQAAESEAMQAAQAPSDTAVAT